MTGFPAPQMASLSGPPKRGPGLILARRGERPAYGTVAFFGRRTVVPALEPCKYGGRGGDALLRSDSYLRLGNGHQALFPLGSVRTKAVARGGN